MYHAKSLCGLLLSPIFVCSAAPEVTVATGFIDQVMTVDNRAVKYQVYLPHDYTAEKEWPVLVFLHGAGERGENPLLATEVGLGSAIRKKPEHYPAIAVFPQCSEDEWWSSEVCERIAFQSLKEVAKHYAIDTKRIYLTGISMGGYGSWHLASKQGDVWAAMYVIAGRVKPGGGHPPAQDSVAKLYSGEELYQMTAKSVAHIPTWIAHGAKDEVVPVTESRKMYQYLRQENANVNYTEFANTWHNSWDKAYANEAAITWLFEQKKEQGVSFARHR